MKDWSVTLTLTRIGEFMLKRIGTVWYFCTTRHFNLFSKDLWHSVISQQFYNIKRCFAERKAKTSRLWILDTGLITERDLFWYQWWNTILSSWSIPFAEQKMERVKCFLRTFVCYPMSMRYQERAVIEQREKIFWIMAGGNCWSNYADFEDWAT